MRERNVKLSRYAFLSATEVVLLLVFAADSGHTTARYTNVVQVYEPLCRPGSSGANLLCLRETGLSVAVGQSNLPSPTSTSTVLDPWKGKPYLASNVRCRTVMVLASPSRNHARPETFHVTLRGPTL